MTLPNCKSKTFAFSLNYFVKFPPLFEKILDEALQHENSDYAAKRSDSIFLDPLSVTIARPGLFDKWLASTGKLGGQRKVPRLANDRHIIDPLLNLNLSD